jgi:hypothetical protein
VPRHPYLKLHHIDTDCAIGTDAPRGRFGGGSLRGSAKIADRFCRASAMTKLT